MKDYVKLTGFNIKINRDTVFHLIDCYQDSPIYEEVSEEYELLEPRVRQLIKPVAYLKFGTFANTTDTCGQKEPAPSLYVLLSIGDEVALQSSKYFDHGDYLSGMLVNAIADTYLFQLDDAIQENIKGLCRARNLGMLARLQAPENIPMNVQKDILEEIKTVENLLMDVTEGYMYTTVKTTGYILMLTQDETVDDREPCCNKCNQINCKLRKNFEVPVTILGREEPIHFQYDGSVSLMEAMLMQGVYFSASCGGRGACGKCKVQVMKGNLEITSYDRAKLGEQELLKGYRLSCKAYPRDGCVIRVATGDEGDFRVVADYKQELYEKKSGSDHFTGDVLEEDYVIAIDIGTTTLAISMIGLISRTIIHTYTAINKQRAFGADVITRMRASIEGKKEALQKSIQKDLLEGIRSILEETKVPGLRIKRIAIAGNTTMGHLLLGYSCDTLGSYPFTPVNIDKLELSFHEVFGTNDLEAVVTLLPGISTFVGGDIVAGLLVCGFDQLEKPCLLIDLGTNGEMAIGNKDKILVSSTAAGPAFEGGNISCGVGSIAGAISSVELSDFNLVVDTIGHKPSIGICGTGVIELASELLKAGLVGDTGLLCEDYFAHGYVVATDAEGNAITFTQRDIRELQLAKAAIRAGAETLLHRYGVTYEDIDMVYLAGGFGYQINLEKAIHIGLLPMELSGKVKAIGNSSLGGAIQYLTEPAALERISDILKVASEIHLSNDKDFNELYIEYMGFEV